MDAVCGSWAPWDDAAHPVCPYRETWLIHTVCKWVTVCTWHRLHRCQASRVDSQRWHVSPVCPCTETWLIHTVCKWVTVCTWHRLHRCHASRVDSQRQRVSTNVPLSVKYNYMTRLFYVKESCFIQKVRATWLIQMTRLTQCNVPLCINYQSLFHIGRHDTVTCVTAEFGGWATGAPYGVATISRLLKLVGLFYKRAL